MKTKFLLVFSFFSVLMSCSTNTHSQFTEFGESNRWQKTDPKTFEFEITDDAKVYNLVFRFSHVYDYQFASVPINFTIESPDGKKQSHNFDLVIKDNSGDLGECAGDICDLNYNFEEKIKLQKGTYKITFSNDFKGPYLPNVIGIGLNVENGK